MITLKGSVATAAVTLLFDLTFVFPVSPHAAERTASEIVAKPVISLVFIVISYLLKFKMPDEAQASGSTPNIATRLF